MPVIVFPPIESASDEGLLAIGGNLDNETLLAAYTQGIFPWPVSKETPLTWFSPDPRGLLYIENFHTSKSFLKFLKKNPFKVKFNSDFRSVIEKCCLIDRKHEEGTWITNEIINAYHSFFDDGHAYSVEVYQNEKLVGGLYGVIIGEYISGESMFFEETNASKVALHALVQVLKSNQIKWLDTQMVTPVIQSMGGEYCDRKDFIELLSKSISVKKTRKQIFRNSHEGLNQP